LHLVCRPDGVPVRVQMLPAGVHDLTPVHELAYGLPAGARLLGDKAYNSAADAASILAETGVRLVPVRNWRRWALSGFTHVPMPGLN